MALHQARLTLELPVIVLPAGCVVIAVIKLNPKPSCLEAGADLLAFVQNRGLLLSLERCRQSRRDNDNLSSHISL